MSSGKAIKRTRRPRTIPGILRTHPEPYGYSTEEQVHHALTEDPSAYLAYVRESLRDIATGKAQLELPPKQIFDDGGGGDFRVMPCVVRRGESVTKTVKLVGTNLTQCIVPNQITVGKAFAIHPVENFVSHVFEACLLSSARTGLCAALAVDLLAPSAKTLTFVGAGKVGYYAAFFTHAVLPEVQRAFFFDLDRERALCAAESLRKETDGDLEVVVREVADLRDTDVLVLATTSAHALCSPTDTDAGLVVSVGADTDFQSELGSGWASAARIYIDTLDSARFGDLKKWLDGGLVRQDELVDLPRLLLNPADMQGGRKVFISTGSAIMDNLTIAYLLERSDS